MKKSIAIMALVLALSGSLAAQTRTWAGPSFLSQSMHETAGSEEYSTTGDSIGLGMGFLAGEPFGLYTGTTIGLAIGARRNAGGVMESLDMSLYGLGFAMDFMLGGGTVLDFGSFDLLLAGGAAADFYIFMPKEITTDEVMYLALGPAAVCNLGYVLSPSFGVYAGMEAFWGILQPPTLGLTEFSWSVALVPSIGLSFTSR